jgi:hypothetical protein
MRAETRVVAVLGGFLLLATVVYWFLSKAIMGRYEWAGTVTLGLSTVLCVRIGGYCGLVARRIPPRPEDRGDATPADAAGEVGFFSPHSYWPAAVGLGAAIAALGIALWEVWIAGLGVVCVVASAAGMLFEYYTGASRGES